MGAFSHFIPIPSTLETQLVTLLRLIVSKCIVVEEGGGVICEAAAEEDSLGAGGSFPFPFGLIDPLLSVPLNQFWGAHHFLPLAGRVGLGTYPERIPVETSADLALSG